MCHHRVVTIGNAAARSNGAGSRFIACESNVEAGRKSLIPGLAVCEDPTVIEEMTKNPRVEGKCRNAYYSGLPFRRRRLSIWRTRRRRGRSFGACIACLSVGEAKPFSNATTTGKPQPVGDIKSGSKSVISALVGIAIEQGRIPSVKAPIGAFFPELAADPKNHVKAAITIENLLSMQAVS